MTFLFGFLMLATAVFLILLVLIQRGRGGGLAGAFGGMGGQSAFGTKAGDLFTRITIGVAAFWIVLCIGAIKVLGHKSDLFGPDKPSAENKEPGLGGASGVTDNLTGKSEKGTGASDKSKGESDKTSGTSDKTSGTTDKASGTTDKSTGTEPKSSGDKDSAPAKDAAPDALTPPAGPPAKSDSTTPPK